MRRRTWMLAPCLLLLISSWALAQEPPPAPPPASPPEPAAQPVEPRQPAPPPSRPTGEPTPPQPAPAAERRAPPPAPGPPATPPRPVVTERQRFVPTHAVGFGMGLSPFSWSIRLSKHTAFRLVGGLLPLLLHDTFVLFQSLGIGVDFFVKGANLQGLFLGVHFLQTWSAGCSEGDCEMYMLTLGPRLLIGYRWQFARTFLSLEGGIQYVYFKQLYHDEYTRDDSWAWPMPHLALRGGFLK